MNCLKRVALAAAFVTVLLTAGCTGSDVLNTGNVAYTINIEVVDAEEPTRYNISLLAITQINVRPNDPAADAALGPLPIGILVETADILDINLNDPAELDPSTIALSSGEYRISTIQLANVLLLDQTDPTPPAQDCTDLFFYQSNSLINLGPDDLGGEAFFNVPAEGAGNLTIRISAAAFIQAFTSTWDCINPPGVPTTFREEEFKALAPFYIDVL